MGMEVAISTSDVGGLTDDEVLSVARQWIVKALSAAKNGHYLNLLKALKTVQLEDPSSLSALKYRLKALAQCVSYLSERDHQNLLILVLGMSIWTYGPDVAEALLEFVVNLATANGSSVGQCLDFLVRNFLPPSCGIPAFLDTYSRTGLMAGVLSMDKIRSLQSSHMARKDEVLAQLHSAIKNLVELVPTAPMRLQPIVLQKMPHKSLPKQWNVLYLENMLRLESSGGHIISNQILPSIVDHLIQIDVEIRWEDILTEDETNKVYMFHMDVEDEREERHTEGENEEADACGPGLEAKLQYGLMSRSSKGSVPTLDEMADKMDVMMDLTLQHLQVSSKKGSTLQTFDILARSFMSTVLNTHKSKFTQFLLFYVCSLDPSTCGSRFANLLCNVLTSASRPPNTRMSAAAYVASYLARARYLPLDVVWTSLRRLVGWCAKYGTTDVSKILSGHVSESLLHGVFYAACQAVMYILCFRFKELADNCDAKRHLRSLNLQHIVEHRLNPLKVCLPSVVEEFLKQATILQLVDSKHWVTTKERADGNHGAMLVGDTRLDMFFPFDPYLLRHSDRFIRPNFIYWSMVESLEENAVSDLEDEVEGSERSFDMESEPVGTPSCKESYESGDILTEDERRHSYPLRVVSRSTKKVFVRERVGSIEVDSPDDNEFVESFKHSFDAMAITPPRSVEMIMPAKLPAKFQVKSGFRI